MSSKSDMPELQGIQFVNETCVRDMAEAYEQYQAAERAKLDRLIQTWLSVGIFIFLFGMSLCTIYLVSVGTLPLIGGMVILAAFALVAFLDCKNHSILN
jgi:hypothetical protein